MFHRRRRTLVVALLVLVVASVALVSSAQSEPTRTLVVSDAESGEQLLAVEVDDGTEVTLSYTHSVEKTQVDDVYVVDDDRLRMTRMVFQSHGAGLPSDETVERTDDGFVVERNTTFETLRVTPGAIAGHELIVGGDRFDLVDRSNGPVVIAVDVDDRNVLERVLGDSTSDGRDDHVASGVIHTHTHIHPGHHASTRT
ncbi:DUF1850 domain-containing protein [Natronosalvus vescus]|uniref:DUF1850 domain-containing protein n=1 Tax=Natronosalvus vescus TaxID=2953881 RepID=UPI0020902FF9|nr:DUF1850 domain-containing protein [Natronosalvus vescus]